MSAPRPLGPRETRELLDRYGLRPRTRIGQHFVVDPNTVEKVVRLARVAPGDRVIEVGPGLGSLTRALVAAGASVVAVEVDRALEPALRESLAGCGVRVVFEDALSVDWAALAGRGASLVANLPYQIATTLVLQVLEDAPRIAEQTVMVQREVGERLAAAPGEPAYGAVSAKIAYFAAASVAGRVSRKVFLPVPEVESVIVRVSRLPAPRVPGDREEIFGVIDAGFGQRRKTIRNALRGAGFEPEAVESALGAAGVPGGERAERLGIEQFAALAASLGSGS